MYHNRRITKKLEQYIPAAKIFEKFSQEAGIAFLDSSLINELGQYSIIGRKPYEILKKEQGPVSYTHLDVYKRQVRK